MLFRSRRENALTQDLHWFFRRSSDSRANQPLTVGVRAADWRQREDVAELGAGPPPSNRTGGSPLEDHRARATVSCQGDSPDLSLGPGAGTPLAHAAASGLQNGWLSFINAFTLLNLASAGSQDSQAGSRAVCYFDEGGVCRQ